jgi:DNA-binding protein YbaB
MTSNDEELLAEMRSSLSAIQEASDRARQRARERRTTLQDKEKLLSATVGGYGELRQITFHGDAYRDLAPAELADLIVKTVRRAHDDAQRLVQQDSVTVAGDLFGLTGTAHRASSIDELIEGIAGLASGAGDRRDPRSGR